MAVVDELAEVQRVMVRPMTPFEATEPGQPRRRSRLKLALYALDAVLGGLGWGLGLAVWGANLTAGEVVARAAVGALLTVAICTRLSLYLARVNSVRSAEVAGLFKVVVFTGLIAGFGGDVLDRQWPAGAILVGGAAAFFLLLTGRSAFRVWLAGRRRAGNHVRHVILIGANEEAAELADIIAQHPEFGIVVDCVAGDPIAAETMGLNDLYCGTVSEAIQQATARQLDGAIVAVSSLDSHDLNDTVRALIRAGLHVQVTSSLRGIDHRRLRAQPIAWEPLFHLEPVGLSSWQLGVKRAMDITLAGGLLLFVAPIIAAFSLAVKIQDGGPPFFKQKRVGRNGTTFEMVKIRTMVVDAEARLEALMKENERKGPLFKMDHDPRFTRLGRFLDATSINELPQLWNVVKGEMSLVGPRPALPREIASFDDALHARHQVRPGITGLWQVEARDNPAFSAYRRFDLFYVENWSVTMDFVIMIATAEAVASRFFRKVS